MTEAIPLLEGEISPGYRPSRPAATTRDGLDFAEWALTFVEPFSAAAGQQAIDAVRDYIEQCFGEGESGDD